MFLFWQLVCNFWQNILQSLGFSGKEGSLLVLGLDNAGKTTLLYRLRTGGEVRPFPPTDRPSFQQFAVITGASGSLVTFSAWDLGGHEAVRHLWEDYVSESVDAVLFLIDASDSSRLEEAAYELDTLIAEKLISGLPVAILLNKCDLHNAMSTKEICERIEWDTLCSQQIDGGGHLAMYRVSVIHGQGYDEALRWICRFL